MSFTVSDLIVETLKSAGVQRVYGIPGDSLNGFTDALYHDGTMTWQHVRHEEAAAFAAAGDAAITGQLAVCAASCGPGNLHLINGLYDAHRSRVPVLAVAAHIPSKEVGGNYFQETHPQELFRECSAYCELVSSPKQLPYALDIALRTAVEQRDVAVLVIPGDVLLQDMDRPSEVATIRPSMPLFGQPMPKSRAPRECFGLYATRAILSGRGDELVDLAVTNVARHLFNGRPAGV